MLSASENMSGHIFSFDDVYDFPPTNASDNNESVDFFQVMELACQPFSRYLQTLSTFYIPIIIAVGFVGNILSFLVLSTTHLKLRSSSYYLAALALLQPWVTLDAFSFDKLVFFLLTCVFFGVADFGFLVGVFVVYCSYNEIFELFNKEGFCQLFTYISQVCAFLSVWLTVAFTTERFIAVRYPLRRQYICTVSRARMIVFVITAIALLSQLHIFWVAGLIMQGDKLECDMKPYYLLLGNIINCVDTFVTLIIPVILILIMNVIIANVVFKSQNLVVHEDDRFSSERVRFHHISSQSSDSTRNSEQEYSTSSRRIKYEDCSLRRHRHTRTTSLQVQQNINKMLLLISSVFVALNFPSYVLRLSAYFGLTLRKKGHQDYISCAQQFAMLLYYTNFSINFLLYAMCGKSFRLCLKKMFRDMYRKLLRCM